MDFGEIIKKKADSMNFSPKDLAELTKRNLHTVYADFKKQDLGTEVIMAYCDAMGITILELFSDGVEKENSTDSVKKPKIVKNNENANIDIVAKMQNEIDYLRGVVDSQNNERATILKNYFDAVQQMLQQNTAATNQKQP